MTALSIAADDTLIAADGNGTARVLNLKTSQNTQSLAWLNSQPSAISLHTVNAVDLPSKFNNQERCSPIWDQAQLGSCTGFASKSAAELIWNILNPDQQDSFIASALFQYYNERKLEGTTDEDSGASIADAIRALIQDGIAPDTDWDYSNYQTKFKEKPSDKAYQDAKQHMDLDTLGHAQIPQSPEAIKTALVQNHAVIFGMRVYESFMAEQTAKTGFVPIPNIMTEKLMGGHALIIVGYDDDNKWYVVKNSWGTSWGDQGYCYIPYAVIHNPIITDEIWGISKMGAGQASNRYWFNPLRWVGY